MLLFFGQARRDAGIAVGAARQCLPGAVATGSLDLVGRQALGQQRGTEQDGWQGISFCRGHQPMLNANADAVGKACGIVDAS
jgi:hypothetical protein